MPKTAQKDASVATVKKQGAVMKHIKKYWQWYAMMFIPIVYYIVFRYIPMFGNIIAFRRYRAGSSIFGDEWSGLKYFNQFMKDQNFWRAFKNTLLLNFKLSIGQTSDDQVDLREELGYACGNFMYGGNTELLTSNFTDDLRDFYDRQGQYRKLRPLDPTVTFDEDQLEMLNLWGTPMTDTVNAWTCKFAMNQADINNDWDTYVAEVEAQNMQNIVDMYNDTYNASK